MNTQKQTPNDRSNTNADIDDDKTGYTDYDRDIAAMADDGHGAAPQARPPRSSET